MSETYTHEDKARTRPVLERAIAVMLPEGVNEGKWMDAETVAALIDLPLSRLGTLKSKLRDLNDTENPSELALLIRKESRPKPDAPRGVWEYRLVRREPVVEPVVEPEQLGLLEAS